MEFSLGKVVDPACTLGLLLPLRNAVSLCPQMRRKVYLSGASSRVLVGPASPCMETDPWRSDGVLRTLATSASSLRPVRLTFRGRRPIGKCGEMKMQFC